MFLYSLHQVYTPVSVLCPCLMDHFPAEYLLYAMHSEEWYGIPAESR